jgi:chromosome partitioning protein
MTHVIAVANEKGGVAKTTTAISLGGALVESGYEVLLVDLDAQANLSLGLNINPATVRRSVADMLLNSASLISISRESNVPGMDVVPSNSDMGMAERFLPVRQNYEYILKNILLSS